MIGSRMLADEAGARDDADDDERRWREFYRDVAPTREDVRRAEAKFKRLVGPARRRRAA